MYLHVCFFRAIRMLVSICDCTILKKLRENTLSPSNLKRKKERERKWRGKTRTFGPSMPCVRYYLTPGLSRWQAHLCSMVQPKYTWRSAPWGSSAKSVFSIYIYKKQKTKSVDVPRRRRATFHGSSLWDTHGLDKGVWKKESACSKGKTWHRSNGEATIRPVTMFCIYTFL